MEVDTSIDGARPRRRVLPFLDRLRADHRGPEPRPPGSPAARRRPRSRRPPPRAQGPHEPLRPRLHPLRRSDLARRAGGTAAIRAEIAPAEQEARAREGARLPHRRGHQPRHRANASGLLCAALLAHDQRGLTAPDLVDRMEFLLKLALNSGGRPTFTPNAENALNPLGNGRSAKRGERSSRQKASSSTRPAASSSSRCRTASAWRSTTTKNTAIHFFVPDALLADEFLTASTDDRVALEQRTLALSKLFKQEFIYGAGACASLFQRRVARFLQLGLVGEGRRARPDQKGAAGAAPYSPFPRELRQSYLTAAEGLQLLKKAPMDSKELLGTLEKARAELPLRPAAQVREPLEGHLRERVALFEEERPRRLTQRRASSARSRRSTPIRSCSRPGSRRSARSSCRRAEGSLRRDPDRDAKPKRQRGVLHDSAAREGGVATGSRREGRSAQVRATPLHRPAPGRWTSGPRNRRNGCPSRPPPPEQTTAQHCFPTANRTPRRPDALVVAPIT